MSHLPLHCAVVPGSAHRFTLPDGTGVRLYRVDTTSARAALLRAVHSDAGAGWLVIDMGQVAPELRQDLPGAPDRDVFALVLRALRRACPTGTDFTKLAREATDEALTRMANAPVAQPTH